VKETAVERTVREMLKIKDFLDLMDTSKKQNVKFINVVHDMNAQQQDLLHELELKKFYSTEGARKAKLLQQLRQERRAVKDTLDLWRPLKNFTNKHPELREELSEVLNEIGTVINEQKNRHYCPRSKQGELIAYQHYAPISMDFDKMLNA